MPLSKSRPQTPSQTPLDIISTITTLSNPADIPPHLLLPSHFSTLHTYLNHGGLGGPPIIVQELQALIQKTCNAQPMTFHRSIVPVLIPQMRDKACEYLGINDGNNFVFMGVTCAIFSVIRGCNFEEGDVVVIFDTIYHSVKDAVHAVARGKKCVVKVLETPRDGDRDVILKIFNDYVEECALSGLRIKLAIVDHISSKPSILFPVKKICETCRLHNIVSLIDGAHTPGSLPMLEGGVDGVGACFWAFTFHKWCNSPRPTGGLYINRPLLLSSPYCANQDISSLSSSHNGDDGYATDLMTLGIYDESTRDYSHYLTLSLCLNITRQYEQTMRSSLSKIVKKGCKILKEMWGSLPIGRVNLDENGDLGDEDEMVLPMVCIPLPIHLFLNKTTTLTQTFLPQSHSPATQSQLKYLKHYINENLWKKFSIEVPVFIWKSELCVRVSVHTRYVGVEDFRALGGGVLEVARGFDCVFEG